MLESGTPAWQRLQGVRAVEAYRELVLGTSQPCLKNVKQKLGRQIALEKERGLASGAPGVSDEKKLIGIIDPSEPFIIQRVRKELRLRRMAMRTETAYVGWIERFICHCGSSELEQFGESQIKAFLTELAVERDVAISTQDQAKSALLFLYLFRCRTWRMHCSSVVLH